MLPMLFHPPPPTNDEKGSPASTCSTTLSLDQMSLVSAEDHLDNLVPAPPATVEADKVVEPVIDADSTDALTQYSANMYRFIFNRLKDIIAEKDHAKKSKSSTPNSRRHHRTHSQPTAATEPHKNKA